MNLQKLIAAAKESGENLPALINRLKGKAPAIEGELVGDLVTQAAPKVLRDVEGELAQKVPLMLQQADEVIPTVTNSIDNIADDVVNKSKGFSNLQKIGAATAIGAGATGLMMSGDDSPQEVKFSPSKEMKQPMSQNITPAPMSKQTEKTNMKSSSSIPVEQAQIEAAIASTSPTVSNADQEYTDAREQDRNRNMMMGLLKAAQMGGSALAGTKADTGFADSELTDKNRETTRLKTGRDMAEQVKNQEEKRKMEDPNSDISKQAFAMFATVYPELAAKYPDLSASQLEKMGMNMGQMLAGKQNNEARKETQALTAEMKRQELNTKKENKMLTDKVDAQKSTDKLVSQLYKSDDYKGYQAAKSAEVALDNAITKGDKTSVGSAFMIYAKIAQGDNSVVRESDMKNLAGSFNYSSPSEMFNKLSAKAQGGNFTPLELTQMKEISKLIQNIKAKHVQQQLSPIQARITNHGLTAEESIDPAILRQFQSNKAPESTTISKKSISLPSKQNPGTMINQKSTGKKFRVNDDGITAAEI